MPFHKQRAHYQRGKHYHGEPTYAHYSSQYNRHADYDGYSSEEDGGSDDSSYLSDKYELKRYDYKYERYARGRYDTWGYPKAGNAKFWFEDDDGYHAHDSGSGLKHGACREVWTGCQPFQAADRCCSLLVLLRCTHPGCDWKVVLALVWARQLPHSSLFINQHARECVVLARCPTLCRRCP